MRFWSYLAVSSLIFILAPAGVYGADLKKEILGKWYMIDNVAITYEFRPNGQVISTINDNTATSRYVIIDDKTMTIKSRQGAGYDLDTEVMIFGNRLIFRSMRGETVFKRLKDQ
jgi:hypothetical protein